MILFVDSKRPASPSARAESLRALVRALVAKDFDGNQQAAATALGVTRATVNQLINGHKGPGQQIADGLVAYLRKSIDDLVAANGDLEALRRVPCCAPTTTRGQSSRSLRRCSLRASMGFELAKSNT